MYPQQNMADKPSPSTEARSPQKKIIKLLSVLVVFFSLILPSMVSAAKVTLAWDANNPIPQGYRIYMRAEGQSYNYNTPAWSGTATTCTIDQLSNNTYYFVARAFQSNRESGDSNEVEFKVVVNQPPQADAGSDQAVSASTQVTLDGSASADPDGTIDTYQWAQTAGPTVTLANATGAKPTFTAPNVASTSTLGFELTVSDAEGLTASDTCQVTVLPVATPDPDSDNDGLSDADETNIYGTDPNNPDTDGDGITDGQEVSDGTDPKVADTTPDPDPEPQYAKIWIEAEDGDIYAPMEIADNQDASEGSYIWVPDRAGSNGYAEYTFEVQTAGEYLIWGRVIANDNASDSFKVSVDGGSDTTWHTKMGGNETWSWDVVSNRHYSDVRDASNPLVYRLEAGVHTLTIKQREDGTKIDRILITNDMTYTPQGAGEQVTSVPQKIWLEAEEGDVFAPMQVATDTNASAGAYVTVPSGAGSGGYAQFTFDIQEAGDYVIWGRVIANNSASDSFLVSVDGANDITWHTKQGGQEIWTWDVVSNRSYADVRDTSNPLAFNLMPGTHTITIKKRENGTKIDRILITNDMDYAPEGIGAQDTPTSQKLWIEAENGTIYAPMQIASNTEASNGSYVWVPNDAGKGGNAEYSFEIQKAGKYVIWGRVIANDSASDSFIVSVDGASDITWHIKQGGQETWTWDVVSNRNYDDIRDASNPVVFSFESGFHTLSIKQRENGAKIDGILITNDIDWLPTS